MGRIFALPFYLKIHNSGSNILFLHLRPCWFASQKLYLYLRSWKEVSLQNQSRERQRKFKSSLPSILMRKDHIPKSIYFLNILLDKHLNRSGKRKLFGLGVFDNNWVCHPGNDTLEYNLWCLAIELLAYEKLKSYDSMTIIIQQPETFFRQRPFQIFFARLPADGDPSSAQHHHVQPLFEDTGMSYDNI